MLPPNIGISKVLRGRRETPLSTDSVGRGNVADPNRLVIVTDRNSVLKLYCHISWSALIKVSMRVFCSRVSAFSFIMRRQGRAWKLKHYPAGGWIGSFNLLIS